MPTKSVFLAIVAVALGFGIAISGCNRDRGRVAARPVDKRASVRPAEVLSASAYRPSARQPDYVAASSVPMMAEAPGLRVVPIHEPLPPAAPIYRQPVQPAVVVHPTPELALARAAMPMPAPSYAAPAPTARQARPAPGIAPIPELEPARYVARATPARRSPQPYAATTQVSYRNRRVEVQRALAPLQEQGWVASPATAMRSGHASY
jgi:hypothetical protein